MIFDIKKALKPINSFYNKYFENGEHTESENGVSEIIHDIKTPVYSQIRACELLLKGVFGKLTPEQEEIILSVINSNKYILDLINNLLFFSKYKNNNSVSYDNFDINELTSACIKKLQYIAREKNCIIKSTYEREQMPVSAYFLGIKRVIINLISNAVNYSDENSVITVITTIKENYCELSVINHGRLIDFKEKKELFKKYNSIENRGFGLGLYISDLILKKHKTKIEIESNPETGNKFSFKLKLSKTFSLT